MTSWSSCSRVSSDTSIAPKNCSKLLGLPASSIEVSRRKRRRKTDRLDAKKLLRLLMRYISGDKQTWSVVRVPSVAEEDERHLHRELGSLKTERTIHTNRIRSLLKLHGIRIDNPSRSDFEEYVAELRLWDGSAIGEMLKDRLKREYRRLKQVEGQIQELKKLRMEQVRNEETPSMSRVNQMMALRGIGIEKF